MTLATTITVLCLAAALTAFANWRSRQDYEPGKMPLIPWNGVQFVGILIIFLMAAHLITLLSGQPFKGRMGGFY